MIIIIIIIVIIINIITIIDDYYLLNSDFWSWSHPFGGTGYMTLQTPQETANFEVLILEVTVPILFPWDGSIHCLVVTGTLWNFPMEKRDNREVGTYTSYNIYIYIIDIYLFMYIYIYIYTYILVGGEWNIFFNFPYGNHHPKWRSQIFQRGGFETTNQIHCFARMLLYACVDGSILKHLGTIRPSGSISYTFITTCSRSLKAWNHLESCGKSSPNLWPNYSGYRWL